MYKAIKIDGEEIASILNGEERFGALKNQGERSFEKFQHTINANLNRFKDSDGVLDGDKLTNEWFPEINADVFISHSYLDFDTALAVTGMLSNLGIKAFVDSCVWGYANDLLKAIDRKYCKNDAPNSYSYEKRNYSTSHVHMMLSVALVKMIYNMECLLFLDTPNSIYPKDDIPCDDKEPTLSPWIFTEIEVSRLLDRRSLDDYRREQTLFSEGQETFRMGHKMNTSHIKEINAGKFYGWSIARYSSKAKALDELYAIVDANSGFAI